MIRRWKARRRARRMGDAELVRWCVTKHEDVGRRANGESVDDMLASDSELRLRGISWYWSDETYDSQVMWKHEDDLFWLALSPFVPGYR
jgi:hypothetical protein